MDSISATQLFRDPPARFLDVGTGEAANRLYKRLGFLERDTNVYRYSLDD